ncbi:MAG: hypothetical protein QXG00_07210 [Candidatus Woesearchaeota archaeon]
MSKTTEVGKFMSLIKYLTEYTKKYMPPSVEWRERRVWHRTPSGKMNFVKIKSLTPEEQLRYKPIDLVKKDKRAAQLGEKMRGRKRDEFIGIPLQSPIPEEKPKVEGEMFDFYYGVKDVDKYKEFEKDKLIVATLDSARAVEMEDDEGLHIVFARNVPLDAIKEYMDEDGDWKEIDLDDKDKKAEFVKFNETDLFKIDLYSYKDIVDLELQNDEEDDEYNDKENEEPVKEYKEYLITKQLIFLFENKELNLLTEAEIVDPKILRWAKQIAEKLKLIFNGFLEYDESLPSHYKNTAFFTDPITKSTLVVQVNDYVEALEKAWEKLKNMRWKFGYDKSETEPIGEFGE